MEEIIYKVCVDSPIIEKEDGRKLFCAMYNQHALNKQSIYTTVKNIWQRDGIPKKEILMHTRSNESLNTFNLDIYVSNLVKENIFSQSSYTFSKYDYEALMLNYYRETEHIRSLDLYLRYMSVEDKWCLLGFVENLLPERDILKNMFNDSCMRIISKYV
jgi:hypothetical protein